MTLREAVRRAVAQNPDVTLARLDEENARHGVQVAKDPFSPRIVVGSGLAYSNGFPMSIEGSAPSIVQARASQFIFNRQQRLFDTCHNSLEILIVQLWKLNDFAI